MRMSLRNPQTNGTGSRRVHRTALVAGLFLATVAAPAIAAQSVSEPVEITSCATVYEPSPEQVYAMGMLTPAAIEISYVNRSDVTIKDVTFRLSDRSDGPTVVDHGNFAPGAAVRHVFWTGAFPVQACSVAAVRFVGSAAFVPTGVTVTANR